MNQLQIISDYPVYISPLQVLSESQYHFQNQEASLNLNDLLLKDKQRKNEQNLDEESFCSLVTDQNLLCEQHLVITDDGYDLTMYRMRTKEVAKLKKGQAPAVLLQHGLFASSDTWIINFPVKAPAFVIAKSGYDVWLGNNRGNKYSRHHQTIDPDTNAKTFFDFSFQDLGEYDLPAMIQKVIEESGRQKISYIGHSQGTSQMFYGLSKYEQRFYKDKINLFIALAPITKLQGLKYDFLQQLAQYYKPVNDLLDQLHVYELFGKGWNQQFTSFCKSMGKYCSIFLEMSSLFSSEYDEPDRDAFEKTRDQAGASRKQLMHYAQLITKDNFYAYDYGPTGNMQKYGQKTAPLFNLQNIKQVPTALFVGLQDKFATPENSQWLKMEIKSANVFYKELANTAHSSFLLGKNMDYLYDVVDLLNHFNPKKISQTSLLLLVQEQISQKFSNQNIDNYYLF